MATIDQKFVEKLELFTNSLEQITELLKEQTKKDNTDVVNKLLKNMDEDRMSVVIEELKAVRTDLKEIKTDTKSIKSSIDELKKEKERNNLFNRIQDPENKDKIVDGIKVIGLIAGGVLAIGLAFKIVGEVDYLSVLSLSAGMVATGYAFTMISKNLKEQKLSLKDIFLTASVLPIMAAGLVISSAIFSRGLFTLTKEQGFTLVVISATMGMAMYLMTKAITDTKKVSEGKIETNLSSYMMLPVILPLIASGILISGWILSAVPTIAPSKLLSIGVITLIAGVSLWLMTKALSKTKKEGDGKDLKSNFQNYLALPVILPLIASGLVAASIIYLMMKTMSKDEAIDLLLTSAAIGASMLVMIPTIYLLSKTGLKPGDTAKMTLILPLIAGGIAVSSWILSEGIYDESKVPSYKWSLMTGLSFIVFGGSMFLLGKFLKQQEIIIGGLAVLGVAFVMMVASKIINDGSYKSFPSYDWSLGVGLSFLVFGGSMAALGWLSMIGGGLGMVALLAGGLATIGMSYVMVEVDRVISGGSYKKFPSYDWSKGVGLSFLVFGGSMAALGGLIITGIGAVALLAGAAAVWGLGELMVEVDDILSGGKWKKDSYPSEEWAKGVGTSLVLFAEAAGSSSIWDKVTDWIFGSNKDTMVGLATEMIKVAETLGSSTIWDKNLKHPSEKWAKGVGISMMYFAQIFEILDKVDIDSDEFGEESVNLIKGIEQVAVYLNDSKIKWDNISTMQKLPVWGDNVSKGISSFVKVLDEIDEASYGKNDINIFELTLDSIVSASTKLKGVSIGSINVSDVSKGISEFIKLLDELDEASYGRNDINIFELTLDSIASASKKLKGVKFDSIEGFTKSIKDLFEFTSNQSLTKGISIDEIISNFSKLGDINTSGIDNLSYSLKSVKDVLDNIDTVGLQKLTSFTNDMLVLSLIDESKLENFIETIDDKKSELIEILSLGRMGENVGGNFETTVVSRQIIQKDTEEKKQEEERFRSLMSRLEIMTSIFQSMLEVKRMDNPEGLNFTESTRSNFNFV